MTASVRILDFTNVTGRPIAANEGDSPRSLAIAYGVWSRRQQGLPRLLDDPSVIDRLAALVSPRKREPHGQ